MQSDRRIEHVGLGSRSYDIYIGSGLLHQAGSILGGIGLHKKTAIVTDTTVGPYYLDTLKASLQACGFTTHVAVLPDGEQYKTLATIEGLYEQLLDFSLDRACSLIALGGGVIGDMAGFAAATFLRGIRLVQIPTTLLAQVDSSVGGKTGVNLPRGKNMVGAFYQPSAVIIDPFVLLTLPDRELRAGLAEVIKYGVIRDPGLFAFLENGISDIVGHDAEAVASVIMQCCRIKADIIVQDETETGVRAHLNYGHTIGHAVETLTGYTSFLHGEAVAIGMLTAARVSRRLGFCSENDVGRVESLLRAAGLPLILPPFPADDYVNAMMKDKKKTGSSVNFVLPRRIGEVFLHPISADHIREFLSAFLPSA